jgi:chitodextrinase
MLYRKASARAQSHIRNSEGSENHFVRWNTSHAMSFFLDVPMLKPIAFFAAFISLLGLSSIHAAAQSAPNLTSPLGTNLAPVDYYSPEQPFLNIFKTANGWTTNDAAGNDTGEEVALYQRFLDSNGYPTTLTPGGSYKFNAVGTLVNRNLNGTSTGISPYLSGQYLFLFDGTGTFQFVFDASATCSSSPCVLNVTSSVGGIGIILKSTGPGSNYAKNFRLIYCGTWNGTSCSSGYDTLLAGGELFNPTFIARIRPFQTLRLMDWMATLSNFQTNWTDRRSVGWVNYADSPTNATINGADPRNLSDGVPIEVMIALCNEIQANCWFNMPPLATDSYVAAFAECVHNGTGCSSSGLSSNLKAYVEYANEVWNGIFASQQSGSISAAPLNTASVVSQMANAGYAQFAGARSSFDAFTDYGALRAFNDNVTWKAVWGADAGRVVRVLGGWNGNPAFSQSLLAETAASLGYTGSNGWSGSLGSHFDALAVAPYFGYAVPDTFTLDQLFAEMMSGGLVSGGSGGYPGGMIKQTLDGAALNYTYAQAAGVQLVAYEGGQNFVNGSDTTLQALYAAANRDPRMGTAYTTFFNGWKNLGGTLFNNYNDVLNYSQWGYWGALENVLQTSSPKYDALINFISANPCWWSGCSTAANSSSGPTTPPSVPAGLAGSLASATQINLSWTASTDSAGVVAGYNVFRNGIKVGTTASNSYSDTGLSVGTGYTYAVSGYDAAGNTSAQSSSISVSTPRPPAVTITSPLNGTLLKGANALKIGTAAIDSAGIASITITSGNTPLMTCSNTTACSAVMSSSSITQGAHVISATATDKWGLQASTSITILSLK